MGTLADATLAAGGNVIGVMPRALVDRERAHTALTKLHIVASMHARKAMMADLADAFILMPGGFGSWDEFCEIITWRQLGMHDKPCGVLNTEGYYDALLAQAAHAVRQGFVAPVHQEMVAVETCPKQLILRLRSE